MAIAVYPSLLCAVLFVLVSASSPAAGTSASSQVSQATVLVAADATLDGRWGRLSGNIALHAARPLATWQAEFALPGIQAGIARDASGVHAQFDASGLVPSLVRSLVPR